MEKFLRFLLTLVLLLLPLLIRAQECDDLYRQGLRLRQTMTVQAQNQAIHLFQQARDCFTDSADIDRCNRQIGLCENVIRRLGGTPVLDQNPGQAASEPVDEPTVSPTPEHSDTIVLPDKTVSPLEAPEGAEVCPPAEPADGPDPAPTTTAPNEIVIEWELGPEETDPVNVLTVDPTDEPKLKFVTGFIEVKIDPDGKIYLIAQENKGKDRPFTVRIADKSNIYVIKGVQRRKKNFLGL